MRESPLRLPGGFIKGLEELINVNCMENNSNTPDLILAQYLIDCLFAFDKATIQRDKLK